MGDIEAEVDRLIDERGGREMLLPGNDAEAVEITPFIFKSTGSTAAYVVIGDGERLIVNTGKGAEAPHHKRLFDAVAPWPTRYIVTTQAHVDHVGGVSCFREPGTTYIAQENNATCQADDRRIAQFRSREARPWFKKNYARQAAMVEASGQPLVQDAPVPDITFADRMRLYVGSLAVDLIHAPGETVDSCVVWLPGERICFTSNTFGPLFPHFPNLNTLRGDRYRFVEPWLQTVARVRDLRPAMLIMGRGGPIVGEELIDASLRRLYAAVEYVHRETLNGMNAGVDLLTLSKTIELPPNLRVGQGYGKVAWGVRTIWESYTGWFERRSTTELYPVAPGEAMADLVRLAGRESVLHYARSQVKDGRPVLALYAAEAILAMAPADPETLEVMVQAHEALSALVGDTNFWEHGWIMYQLDLWREKLAGIDRTGESANAARL
jgi:glyoxylase-like metal-dependent hydrolase (beta-lactamase superfamily II)